MKFTYAHAEDCDCFACFPAEQTELEHQAEVSLEHPSALSNLPHDDDLEEESRQREHDEWVELSADW